MTTHRSSTTLARRAVRIDALLALVLLGGAAYLVSRRASAGAADPPAQPQSAPARPAAEEAEPSSTLSGRAGSTAVDGAEDADGDGNGVRVQSDRFTLDAELGTGAVDGVWWPTTDVAADALPSLVGQVPDDLGRVVRISLPMADWSDDQPRSLVVDGRPVNLGWFGNMQRHTVRVTLDTDEAVTLLVLPPDTESDAAAKLLSSTAGERSRSELFREAGMTPDGRADEAEQD